MSDEQKSSYERTLKVTAIFRRHDEPTQFTFEQFKKKDEAFKLIVNTTDGLFELGDIVTLTIAKSMEVVQ